MAALVTYCFDGLNFSQASTLYTDSTLTTPSPDGFYSQSNIVRQQVNGVLLNAQPCGTCSVACGTGVEASFSGNGLFNATIDVGSGLGAIVLYFYMGSSVPDGVLGTYNSNTYNRLTCEGNHNTFTIVNGANTQVDYAGILNQGTGRITYVGNSNASLLSDSPYDNTPSGSCSSGDKPQNYTYTGASYVAQGTFETVTVASNEIGVNPTGSRIFTMIIPKTSAAPSTINLLIGAPMCGTVFNWEVDCPAALPSFTASGIQSTLACAFATTTYYFARNATGTSSPFTVDTNTTPNVGNFVFTDRNGSTYLNDTSLLKYIIIANTTAIGVRNGVVVSSAACTGGATRTQFFATGGSSAGQGTECSVTVSGLLYHDGSGTLPQVGDKIYNGPTGPSFPFWSNFKGFAVSDAGGGAEATGTIGNNGIITQIFVCP